MPQNLSTLRYLSCDVHFIDIHFIDVHCIDVHFIGVRFIDVHFIDVHFIDHRISHLKFLIKKIPFTLVGSALLVFEIQELPLAALLHMSWKLQISAHVY